jgi:hypothetical protein
MSPSQEKVDDNFSRKDHVVRLMFCSPRTRSKNLWHFCRQLPPGPAIDRGGRTLVQLNHMGWDQHENLSRDIQMLARSSDQASEALVKDLKQRGLLEDTLGIWSHQLQSG